MDPELASGQYNQNSLRHSYLHILYRMQHRK